MNSLRVRLFAILVAATGLVWLAAVAWTYWDSRSRFETILDRRLMEAARMVDSLVTSAKTPLGTGDARAAPLSAVASYDRHLSCQVWSFDGRLVAASEGAPDPRLTDRQEGFSDRTVDGQRWRVFALSDPTKGFHVLVGDNLEQRMQLEHGLIGGFLLTAACILPILALLIWLSVGRGLRPLTQATHDLSARNADNLERLEVGRAPSEVRPLFEALNRLFGKVAAARDHEQSFLAYAAHELRTPLAGLKTQVQVAMAATDPAMREAALGQTLVAVDRSARMVQQLLVMSQLDSDASPHKTSWIAVEDRLRELLAGMDRRQDPGRVTFSDAMATLELRMDENLFDLAMRNLMENALLMTPPGGTISWSAEIEEGGAGSLSLEDEGPGIPEDERPRVLQRFVRGSKRSRIGSGLGLAIVTAALERSGAALRLGSKGASHGLKADVRFGAGAFRLAQARP